MSKNKGFILWIAALIMLLVLGGVLMYAGLSDYMNGTRLPHHGEKLAQGIFRMLC